MIIHYITAAFQAREVLLRVEELHPPHTAEVISNWIRKVLDDYGLSERPITFVTDGEAALVAAVTKNLKYPRVYCMAHLISLIVGKLLLIPDVQALEKKIKALTTHFHSSHNALYELRDVSF